MPIEINNAEEVSNVLTKFKNFIFDCDGVLYCGSEVIPCAKETLDLLLSMGKSVFFLTNNSTKSRQIIKKGLQDRGLGNIPLKQVYGSAYAASLYFRELYGGGKNGKEIFVIGHDGIKQELDLEGIKSFGYEKFGSEGVYCEDKVIQTYQEISQQKDIGAVLIGYDRLFNITKCAFASLCIRNGAQFVATNTDPQIPWKGGFLLPGGGTMVKSVATSVGKEPLVLGKPETLLIDEIIKENGLLREETVMIGDRMIQDISMGNRAKLGGTILTLSGASSKESVEKMTNPMAMPTYIIEHIGKLYELSSEKTL